MEDIRNKMEQDPRFFVNNETMDSLFANHTIYDYRIEEIPVGKIRRTVKKKIYKLEDTINYKVLVNRYDGKMIKEYNDYSRMTNNTKDNSSRSLKTYDSLINTFTIEDYSLEKGAIIVNQYNFIVDGLHRSCILLDKYGPNYKIEVVKIHCKVAKRTVLTAPLFEILLQIKGSKHE